MGLRARILLRNPLSEEERNAIGFGLRKFCKQVENGYFDEEGWDFWVANGKAIRINYKGPMRRLYISFYPSDEEIENREARALHTCFGWCPTSAFTVGAYEETRADHLLLGGLVLNIAEQFNGLVDYRGYLTPGSTVDTKKKLARVLLSMKGKLCTVNASHQYHVSDPSFLESWLQHPRFKMI